METKKSTVKRITHNVRQWNSPNGTLYYHTIEFENGDKGDYGSKTESCTKFTEGKEEAYTIESKVSGNYTNVIIKPVQEQQPNPHQGVKRSYAGNESFALSYAKDVACANIENGKEISAKNILEVAQAFYGWLESKRK